MSDFKVTHELRFYRYSVKLVIPYKIDQGDHVRCISDLSSEKMDSKGCGISDALSVFQISLSGVPYIYIYIYTHIYIYIWFYASLC